MVCFFVWNGSCLFYLVSWYFVVSPDWHMIAFHCGRFLLGDVLFFNHSLFLLLFVITLLSWFLVIVFPFVSASYCLFCLGQLFYSICLLVKSDKWIAPRIMHFFAFICITFHLHYICISFAFRIAPRISIFALHFISI